MKTSSLRWRFTAGFIVLQVFAIVVSLGLVLYSASGLAPDKALQSVWLSSKIADSLRAEGDGRIELDPTPALADMMQELPSLWFIVELPDGSSLRHGEVPPEILESAPFLRSFRSVEMRGYTANPARLARVERVETEIGEITLFAGGASMTEHGIMFWIGNVAVAVPAVILMCITLVGVPWVTRWSVSSLNVLTDRLDRVNFNARGSTVDDGNLPSEVRPVVHGINMALRRLDEGFESTERFFVNAAHELRTPIAVLQVRVDTLAPSEEKQHLQRGVKRLTAIAHQLLDVENYRQKPPIRREIDLARLVSKVVADLAPFAIAEGYEISFEAEEIPVTMQADEEALERVFENLIRNAIQYGGGTGDISVEVSAEGMVTVSDQGPGIPPDKRDRIFDPFYRVNPQGSGAGLGLAMVRQIVESHGGSVQLAPQDAQGSMFIVSWKPGVLSLGTLTSSSL